MAWSRATKRLADLGLIVRRTDASRDRARWVQPTAAGLSKAIELAGDTIDSLAVMDGLRLTEWGQELAEQIIDPAQQPSSCNTNAELSLDNIVLD